MSAATASRGAVVISSQHTQNIVCSAGTCSPTAPDAVLNVNDLKTLLASGNLAVLTTGSVQANDITVEVALAWSNAHTLTLDAYHSIAIDSHVSLKGAGGLDLVTNDGGSGGTLAFAGSGQVTFANLSSALVVNGKSYVLVSSIARLAHDIKGNPGSNFALARNLDAGRAGTYTSPPIPTSFSGTFEGLGNTISNLSIDDPNPNDLVGLFSSNLGTINDLVLSGVTIVGQGGTASKASIVGALAALNFGTMVGDQVSGNLSTAMAAGYANLGALAAANSGTITFCSSLAAVTAGDSSNAGSLVGLNNTGGSIINSYATGVVGGGNDGQTGGLSGDNVGTISLSYATGAVSGGTNAGVGGLSGTNVTTGSVLDDYASGTVAGGQNTAAGGLLGFNYASVGGSYASGNVEVANSGNAGGLVGASGGNISGSFASGAVTGSGSYVQAGGLVGSNFGSGAIDSSWAVGSVTAGDYASVGGLAGNNVGAQLTNAYAEGNASGGLAADAGGLVGYNNATVFAAYSTGAPGGGQQSYEGGLIGYADTASSISDGYWDVSTSGITNLNQGAGNISDDAGITGLTTSQLQSGLPTGFASQIWSETTGINGGLPYLIANPPQNWARHAKGDGMAHRTFRGAEGAKGSPSRRIVPVRATRGR